ncbi:MAG: hypothetical protein PWP51_48 [Clostridiales bacterium]|jgi:hypothetical protein|nr:hypothetical protein [Clostridiales bacterium]MDN5297495.1 hypothetical protein [Clostridiales bacterium]
MIKKYMTYAKRIQSDVESMRGASSNTAEKQQREQPSGAQQRDTKILFGIIGAIILLSVVGLHFWLLN